MGERKLNRRELRELVALRAIEMSRLMHQFHDEVPSPRTLQPLLDAIRQWEPSVAEVGRLEARLLGTGPYAALSVSGEAVPHD